MRKRRYSAAILSEACASQSNKSNKFKKKKSHKGEGFNDFTSSSSFSFSTRRMRVSPLLCSSAAFLLLKNQSNRNCHAYRYACPPVTKAKKKGGGGSSWSSCCCSYNTIPEPKDRCSLHYRANDGHSILRSAGAGVRHMTQDTRLTLWAPSTLDPVKHRVEEYTEGRQARYTRKEGKSVLCAYEV